MEAYHGCKGYSDAIVHYEEGSEFAQVKYQLDSNGNRRRLPLFLLKIIILVVFVYYILIYAIKYDDARVN